MSNCTNDGCACTPNSAIKCTVTSCAHHCSEVNNCGLRSIQDQVYRLQELPEAVKAQPLTALGP